MRRLLLSLVILLANMSTLRAATRACISGGWGRLQPMRGGGAGSGAYQTPDCDYMAPESSSIQESCPDEAFEDYDRSEHLPSHIPDIMDHVTRLRGDDSAHPILNGGNLGGEEPVSGWIDPDLLEESQCEDCICVICSGVMVEPVSGCPEGHSCCRICYGKALRVKKQCPSCRHPVADPEPRLMHHRGPVSTVPSEGLVRMRPLDGMIARLRLRCDHAEGGKGNETAEEGTPAAAGCGWRGRVGELAAHRGECLWAPVKCPDKSCTASLLRKDLPEHDATCGTRTVLCGFCEQELMCRSLAEHERSCPSVVIRCTNEGCFVRCVRGAMVQHRATHCQQEKVTC